MRKKRQISFKECYAILEVDKSATLDDVKKAYRRRAFELHPDLNPGDPNAVRNFQLLNEAYVALSQVLQAGDVAAQARTAAQGKGRGEAQQGGATGPSADSKGTGGADDETGSERDASAGKRERTQRDKDRERAEAREREQEKQRAREREREKIRRAAAENARKREQEKQAQEQAARQAQQEQQARQAQEQAAQQEQQAQQEQPSAGGGSSAQARAASAAYGQEDVLRDLLNDPFARRVFEDIYSEVNRQAQDAANKAAASDSPEAPTPQAATARQPEAPKPESQQVEADWEAPRTNFDFTKGVKGVVKDWLRRQIDEEQTFVLPASSLRPGVRLRLQIRRGLSDELSTIEVTLPRDFVVGKPVRLRGLGKKVGSWQGDLYLTFKAR